jgi:hypothetical protein
MKAIVLALLLLLAGCAQPLWLKTQSPLTMEQLDFSADLPDGWMRSNRHDFFLMTRDGVPLQMITVYRTKVDAPLRFTKKKLEKGMLPHEVAEVIADNQASNQGALNFKLEENRPVTTAGRPGFRIIYSLANSQGLKQKGVVCGFIDGDWYYELRYNAAERHYFEKDLGTFDKFVASFRLGNRQEKD